MPAAPRPVKSSLLAPSDIQDIISAIVAAVSSAIPAVPESVTRQIRLESERAAKDMQSMSAVYENLFTGNVLEPALPPRSFLTVLDYSIAYRFTQCDTERLGRVMNLTKTAARSTLGDINFPASVYVTYNSPPIGEINFKRLVQRFKKNHRLAVMSEGGSRAKQVIARHTYRHA